MITLEFIGMSLVFFVAAVALFAAYPALRWNTRAQWGRTDLVFVLLPFVVWAGCFFSANANKSFANLFDEPLLLGLVVGLLAWARIWLATPLGATRAAVYCGIVAAASGGAVWFLMPGLRE